jgi:hypothetical protein
MVDEDLHINGIVGSFNAWDVFAPGPFIVTIVHVLVFFIKTEKMYVLLLKYVTVNNEFTL